MLAKHERDNSSFRPTEKEVVVVVDTNLVSIFDKEKSLPNPVAGGGFYWAVVIPILKVLPILCSTRTILHSTAM